MTEQQKKKPFLCVITPVFEPAMESLQHLMTQLFLQTFTDFIHINISNGPSPKIENLIAGLHDPRFQFFSVPFESTPDGESLMVNLGKRRDYALKNFSAERFVFLDADLSVFNEQYFQLLYETHQKTGKDFIITQVHRYDKILPIFPIQLGHIDMANFSFSEKIAKSISYPTDLDSHYGFGNDYRFFERIRAAFELEFIECITASIGSNRSYSRVTDKKLEETYRTQKISLFGNSFDQEDLNGVKAVLDSHLVGTGKVVQKFSDEFRSKIGFQGAVATNSCTNAFRVLFYALKLKPTDEVIVPNIHFIGIKHALNLSNVVCRIVDVGSGVPNITVESVASVLNENTRAIIFLDFGGYPAPVDDIKAFLKEKGRSDVLLILDAANSPFTMLRKKYTAQAYDFALYSFDMNKILVTGDGGMILSNNMAVLEDARRFAYFGMDDDFFSGYERTAVSDVWWESQFTHPGIMFTMNNIAASLGLTQLKKVDAFLHKRDTVVHLYRKKLLRLVQRGCIEIPPEVPELEHNCFFFWIMIKDTPTRNGLARHMLQKGVYTTVKYQPLDATASTSIAFDFYARSLCIPLHQNLREDEVDYIVSKLFDFFEHTL